MIMMLMLMMALQCALPSFSIFVFSFCPWWPRRWCGSWSKVIRARHTLDQYNRNFWRQISIKRRSHTQPSIVFCRLITELPHKLARLYCEIGALFLSRLLLLLFVHRQIIIHRHRTSGFGGVQRQKRTPINSLRFRSVMPRSIKVNQ